MACEVGTIREIHERLMAEGFHVTQYALRLWIKQGLLPAIYTGNKALISYSKVISLLTCGPTPCSHTAS